MLKLEKHKIKNPLWQPNKPMTKQELITKILKKVEEKLENCILEQFEQFEIIEETPDSVIIQSFDTKNNFKNNSMFEYNWYN